MTLRPSVAADIAALGLELPYRFKGMTGLIGDRVVGLAGIGYRPDGVLIATAYMTDEARKHRFAFHRAARRWLAAREGEGVREIVATADPDIPGSELWLRHLGFMPITRNGERVFVWRN